MYAELYKFSTCDNTTAHQDTNIFYHEASLQYKLFHWWFPITHWLHTNTKYKGWRREREIKYHNQGQYAPQPGVIQVRDLGFEDGYVWKRLTRIFPCITKKLQDRNLWNWYYNSGQPDKLYMYDAT